MLPLLHLWGNGGTERLGNSLSHAVSKRQSQDPIPARVARESLLLTFWPSQGGAHFLESLQEQAAHKILSTNTGLKTL